MMSKNLTLFAINNIYSNLYDNIFDIIFKHLELEVFIGIYDKRFLLFAIKHNININNKSICWIVDNDFREIIIKILDKQDKSMHKWAFARAIYNENLELADYITNRYKNIDYSMFIDEALDSLFYKCNTYMSRETFEYLQKISKHDLYTYTNVIRSIIHNKLDIIKSYVDNKNSILLENSYNLAITTTQIHNTYLIKYLLQNKIIRKECTTHS